MSRDIYAVRTADGMRAEIDRLNERLQWLETLPAEPTNDPAIIYFEKMFNDAHTYTYAAVKVKDNGLWYTTGPSSPKGYTWDELVQWIGDTTTVWVATELGELVRPVRRRGKPGPKPGAKRKGAKKPGPKPGAKKRGPR